MLDLTAGKASLTLSTGNMAQVSSSNEPTVSPPPERPRREGNDSLWKRARRTLGTNSLTFLQPQSRPTGKSLSQYLASSLNSVFPSTVI